MGQDCAIRFCDNQKIENYTLTSEDVNYPFTNALSTVRSKLYKTTSNTNQSIIVDLGFADEITAFGIFGALGKPLGITEFGTITLSANNINEFTTPPFQVTVDQNDQQAVWFSDGIEDTTYRYWEILIDDPGNPDFINFGYIYLGDYTAPILRNINQGFGWSTIDRTSVVKSLNGTAYFDVRTKYDIFDAMTLGLMVESDRLIMQRLYDRLGISSPVMVSIDPTGVITSDLNQLTRLARFSSSFRANHRVFEYFDVSFTLEEVI